MPLREIFTRNRWQKGLAVFLATMIWVTVRSGFDPMGEDHELASVEVAVLAAPADTGVYRLNPSTVRVSYRVESKTGFTLQPEDLEVFVNILGEVNPAGLHELHVHAPDGVRVVEVVPKRVVVQRMSVADSVHR